MARPAGRLHHVATILGDPDRTFVASVFLRLEVLPKPLYFRRTEEVDFCQDFFRQVAAWAEPVERVAEEAERLAARYGLSALDSLHLAAAIMLGADEFVTAAPRGHPPDRAAASGRRNPRRLDPAGDADRLTEGREQP